MTQDPLGRGAKQLLDELLQANGEDVQEADDVDFTAAFPQWSRSLLLLLDYAIIEGLQHDLPTFVHHLKKAETELALHAQRSAQVEKGKLPSSKKH